jgi:PIN domain nuclease of toxin-antitoxin system
MRASLALLLDTHVIVWLAAGYHRLSKRAIEAALDPDMPLVISAVTAWEYADLEQRGRFVGSGPLAPILEQLDIEVLDYPAALWPLAATLPPIHRDPVDRMLIAHALALEMPLVTADANIARYPGLDVVWE